MVFKYFLQVCSLPSHCLNRVFHKEKAFNFDKVQFIDFFSLMDHVFSVISKNSSPIPRSQRFFLCVLFFFFSESVIVLYLTFQSIASFELVFV